MHDYAWRYTCICIYIQAYLSPGKSPSYALEYQCSRCSWLSHNSVLQGLSLLELRCNALYGSVSPSNPLCGWLPIYVPVRLLDGHTAMPYAYACPLPCIWQEPLLCAYVPVSLPVPPVRTRAPPEHREQGTFPRCGINRFWLHLKKFFFSSLFPFLCFLSLISIYI